MPIVIAKGMRAGVKYRIEWFVPDNCASTRGRPAKRQAPTTAAWGRFRMIFFLRMSRITQAIRIAATRMLTPCPSRQASTDSNQRTQVVNDGDPAEFLIEPRAYAA